MFICIDVPFFLINTCLLRNTFDLPYHNYYQTAIPFYLLVRSATEKLNFRKWWWEVLRRINTEKKPKTRQLIWSIICWPTFSYASDWRPRYGDQMELDDKRQRVVRSLRNFHALLHRQHKAQSTRLGATNMVYIGYEGIKRPDRKCDQRPIHGG